MTWWGTGTIARIRSAATIVLWIELIFVATLPLALLTYLLPSENIHGEANGLMGSLRKVPLELWAVSGVALALAPFLAIMAMSERVSRFRRAPRAIVALANIGLVIYALILLILPFVPTESKIASVALLAMGCSVVVALLSDTDKVSITDISDTTQR